MAVLVQLFGHPCYYSLLFFLAARWSFRLLLYQLLKKSSGYLNVIGSWQIIQTLLHLSKATQPNNVPAVNALPILFHKRRGACLQALPIRLLNQHLR